ncbi:MAG TPA: tetratricopeptide repeat protein [Trichocoleus sp.]
MGPVLDVTSETFAEAVLQQSFQKPVLIDFFAQWCGPCQILKPVLEKLVQEYDFVLAKVDIDQNPDLATRYQVEGVPDVRVVLQGQVDKGFVGVLTEGQIRDFLGRLGLKSSFEEALAKFEAVNQPGKEAEAGQILTDLQSQFPANPELMLLAAQFYLKQGQVDQAQAALASLSPHDREYGDRIEALKGLIEFQQAARTITPESELDQLYVSGCKAAVAEEFELALEQFLALVERQRTYRNEAARKAMIIVFKILGDDNTLTRSYRKRLMQALY